MSTIWEGGNLHIMHSIVGLKHILVPAYDSGNSKLNRQFYQHAKCYDMTFHNIMSYIDWEYKCYTLSFTIQTKISMDS